MKAAKKKQIRPPQKQAKQPGREGKMRPEPDYMPSVQRLKLEKKCAVITGGDSGIGRAVALAFAKEGADLVIAYLNEHEDANTTKELAASFGAEVELITGDVADPKHCKKIIKKAVASFGKVDILVNNAAVQYPQQSILDIDNAQLLKTFSTNIFSHFYLTREALPFMKEGSSIICTTSVTAYRGSHHLLDYASTKGAIVSFIRSLSTGLAEKGIRVNGVAPGPIWTPLIPATFPAEHVATFGSDVPLQRAGEPNEVAPAYVYLASDDSSYVTGQILHVNGGEIVNG